MEAIVEHSCGLDVHQSVVLACLIIGETGRKPSKTVRRYGTTTREVKAMREWLLAMGCDRFYEVGPGRVLRGLLKRIERKVECVGTE